MGLKLNEAHLDSKQPLKHNLIRIILLLQIAYGPVDFLTLIGSSFGVENDTITFEDLNDVFMHIFFWKTVMFFVSLLFLWSSNIIFSYLNISLASFFVQDVCRLSSSKSLMRPLGKCPSPLNVKYWRNINCNPDLDEICSYAIAESEMFWYSLKCYTKNMLESAFLIFLG